jgi:hypothetical protein
MEPLFLFPRYMVSSLLGLAGEEVGEVTDGESDGHSGRAERENDHDWIERVSTRSKMRRRGDVRYHPQTVVRNPKAPAAWRIMRMLLTLPYPMLRSVESASRQFKLWYAFFLIFSTRRAVRTGCDDEPEGDVEEEEETNEDDVGSEGGNEVDCGYQIVSSVDGEMER